MTTHYKLLRLTVGEEIFFGDCSIDVVLDKVKKNKIVQSDRELFDGQDPKKYLFVSGGGTFLINGRYLLLVRRQPNNRINAGKLSLFTGRSNGPEEWVEPWRVVRELFEEIVLFDSSKFFYPKSSRYQQIIDEVYKSHVKHGLFGNLEPFDLRIVDVSPENNVLSVRQGSRFSRQAGFAHINSRNEINLLFLFSIQLDLDSVKFRDLENPGVEREIYIYDLVSRTARMAGDSDASFQVSPIDITEHLLALLDALGVS